MLLAIASTNAVAQNIPMNGLIGWFKGDNSAADASTTHNDGSFGGSYVQGGPGGDAAFDLSTGLVIIPNNAVYHNFVNDPGWTVGFWFNNDGRPQNGPAFLGQDDGPGFKPKWFIDYGYTVFGPTNDFVLHFNDFNQERIFLESASVPLPSGWNQLTVSVDNVGRTVSFFLDGLAIGTDALPAYSLGPSSALVLGAAETGLTYNGLMNNVTIYDRALSPEEAKQLYAINSPEPSSIVLVMTGLAALTCARRRSSKTPSA